MKTKFSFLLQFVLITILAFFKQLFSKQQPELSITKNSEPPYKPIDVFTQNKNIIIQSAYKPYKANFKRFLTSTENKWNNKNIRYHNGHKNILKYAYITSVFNAIKRNEKLSYSTFSDYNRLKLPSLFKL